MNVQVNLDSSYITSQNVVAREIEGEFIIVPLASCIGDANDEIYALNETGRAIWEKLDGHRSLREVARDLEAEFEACSEEIESDVLGLVKTLLKRQMVLRA